MHPLQNDFEIVAKSVCDILYKTKEQREDFYRWLVPAKRNLHAILRAVPDAENYSFISVAREHSLEGMDRLDFQEYLLNQVALWRFSFLCSTWITEDGLDAVGVRFFCYEYSERFIMKKLTFLDGIIERYLSPAEEVRSSDNASSHKRLSEKWVSI